MPPILYVVEYDANSCAWLVDIAQPSYRIPLEHGMVVTVLPACAICAAPRCVCDPAAPAPGGTA